MKWNDPSPPIANTAINTGSQRRVTTATATFLTTAKDIYQYKKKIAYDEDDSQEDRSAVGENSLMKVM